MDMVYRVRGTAIGAKRGWEAVRFRTPRHPRFHPLTNPTCWFSNKSGLHPWRSAAG